MSIDIDRYSLYEVTGLNGCKEATTVWDEEGLFVYYEDHIEKLRTETARADALEARVKELEDQLQKFLEANNVDEYTIECLTLAQGARDFFKAENKQLRQQLEQIKG